MSRKTSLLSNPHRELLEGKREPRKSDERAMRTEMRKRIRNGILDFSILFGNLSAKDRQMIFQGARASTDGEEKVRDNQDTRPLLGGDPLLDGDIEPGLRSGWIDPDREFGRASVELEQGMVDAIAFFYVAASDAGLDSKSLIEHSVKRAEEQLYDDRWIINDVSLDVDRSLQHSLAKGALQKMQNGEELTNAEVRVLHTSQVGQAAVSPEQIQGYLTGTWEPDDEELALYLD